MFYKALSSGGLEKWKQLLFPLRLLLYGSTWIISLFSNWLFTLNANWSLNFALIFSIYTSWLWLCIIILMVESVITTAMLGRHDELMKFLQYDYFQLYFKIGMYHSVYCLQILSGHTNFVPASSQFPDSSRMEFWPSGLPRLDLRYYRLYHSLRICFGW